VPLTPVMIAEENDLIHVGDVLIGAWFPFSCVACLRLALVAGGHAALVLRGFDCLIYLLIACTTPFLSPGVSGLLIVGMSLSQVHLALASARATTTGGAFGECAL
jgi:hypothetical protein